MVFIFCFLLDRVPRHKDKVNRALLKLVSDLCPSNSEVPDKAGKEGILSFHHVHVLLSYLIL